jgi:hypothetical protein
MATASPANPAILLQAAKLQSNGLRKPLLSRDGRTFTLEEVAFFTIFVRRRTL